MIHKTQSSSESVHVLLTSPPTFLLT